MRRHEKPKVDVGEEEWNQWIKVKKRGPCQDDREQKTMETAEIAWVPRSTRSPQGEKFVKAEMPSLCTQSPPGESFVPEEPSNNEG
jgi:hypothetical protein